MNKFILDYLHQRAEEAVQAASKQLAQRQAMHQRSVDQCQQLADYGQQYRDQQQQASIQQTLIMSHLQRQYQFVARIDQALQQHQQDMQRLQQEVVQQRLHVQQAQQRAKQFEVLIERNRRQQEQREHKREQRANDEFAARIHRQRQGVQR